MTEPTGDITPTVSTEQIVWTRTQEKCTQERNASRAQGKGASRRTCGSPLKPSSALYSEAYLQEWSAVHATENVTGRQAWSVQSIVSASEKYFKKKSPNRSEVSCNLPPTHPPTHRVGTQTSTHFVIGGMLSSRPTSEQHQTCHVHASEELRTMPNDRLKFQATCLTYGRGGESVPVPHKIQK